jgi:putative FmdB family regulatory protein
VPIYEFYCADCHTVYSFLSRTVNTTKQPKCPRCGRADLERRMSRFAISKGQPEGGQEDDGPMGPDEAKIERALEQLAAEHDSLDQDDPRHAIPMIQKVCEIAGVPIPDTAREAMRRIEAGEDPEKIEEEVGDIWGAEDSPFSKGGRLRDFIGKLAAPRVDQTLYDL